MHEHLVGALLEPAHVDQAGRDDLAAVDGGHPGHRHEDAAPAGHLDDEPDDAGAAPATRRTSRRRRAPARPGHRAGRTRSGWPGGRRRRGTECSRRKAIRLVTPSSGRRLPRRRRGRPRQCHGRQVAVVARGGGTGAAPDVVRVRAGRLERGAEGPERARPCTRAAQRSSASSAALSRAGLERLGGRGPTGLVGAGRSRGRVACTVSSRPPVSLLRRIEADLLRAATAGSARRGRTRHTRSRRPRRARTATRGRPGGCTHISPDLVAASANSAVTLSGTAGSEARPHGSSVRPGARERSRSHVNCVITAVAAVAASVAACAAPRTSSARSPSARPSRCARSRPGRAG